MRDPGWNYAAPRVPAVPFGCVAQLARLAIRVLASAYCSLLNSSPSMRLIRNRLTHSRDTGPPPSSHRLGARDLALEAKRCRHRAVAIPIVRSSDLYACQRFVIGLAARSVP
jgi:hypothetical protein